MYCIQAEDGIRFGHVTGVQTCALPITPLHEHAHITIDCMKAGLHVFCEKSMARTLEDVKAMYDTHLEEGRILLIGRSEEHTSELQSRGHLVCRLLLEKKKKTICM